MTILHLIDTFNRVDGCSRHVLQLACEQRRRDHTVQVIAGGGDAADDLAAVLPCNIIPEISHASRTMILFLRGVMNLRTVIQAIKPDIVHAHHYYGANQSRFGLSGAKLILTVHQNLPCGGRLPLYPGHHVIAVSESTRRNILACQPSVASRLSVIPNGVLPPPDGGRAQESAEFGHLRRLREQVAVVAFIGRMVPEKGLDVLISALEQIRQEHRIVLAVAGEGPEKERYMSRAGTAGIDVIDFGALESVYPLLNTTDILVLPSLRLEGMPMILLEAGIAGTAVIASRTAGAAEVIRDNETGLLFEPGDRDQLSECLRKLISNPDIRRALAQRLHDVVSTEFPFEKMVDRVEEIYHRALS